MECSPNIKESYQISRKESKRTRKEHRKLYIYVYVFKKQQINPENNKKTISTHLSITTLDVDRLNAPIKRYG